jgi:hypothetical protein
VRAVWAARAPARQIEEARPDRGALAKREARAAREPGLVRRQAGRVEDLDAHNLAGIGVDKLG